MIKNVITATVATVKTPELRNDVRISSK